MAAPHGQITGTRLYSKRIRLPFGGKPVVEVFRDDEEGRYYTDHPLLNGRYASYKQIGDRIRELRDMLEFRIQQPVVMQPQAQGPAVMPPRSQLRPPASEKLVAGAAEIASAAALKEPVIPSLEGCLTTVSPEELITTSPGTASHNIGSSNFSAFRCEVSVTGAAGFAFGQVLQDPYFASFKNLLDTTPLEESTTAVPQTVPHNAIDSSPSTFPSCHEKLVAGTAESLPTLQYLDGSSLDKFTNEFTTTNGFQQSASSIVSCEEFMTASSGTASHNTRLSSCEKFVAGAAEFASGKALQDKHFASSKELPNDSTALEASITVVPQTVPHKITDGSPSTLQSSCEKFVSGAAETIPAMQDRDVSYLDKILREINDSSSVETISAVPKTVSHNSTDGSPSTLLPSCGKKLVSGSAKTNPARRHRQTSFLDVSYLNRFIDDLIGELIDNSSEESTTASPWTVPHNATDGCQQPASGDHCYGCRNNRDPVQNPKNTNACTGSHFVDGPGVILSDYDDDDDFDNYEVDVAYGITDDDDDIDDDDDDDREDEDIDDVVED